MREDLLEHRFGHLPSGQFGERPDRAVEKNPRGVEGDPLPQGGNRFVESLHRPVYAGILPLGGDQAVILGQLQAQRPPQRTVKLLHSLTGPGGDFNIDGRRRWKTLLCRRKIGLICKDQMRPFLYQLVEGTFLPGERTGAVEQKQNQIARFDRLLRAKHPDLLDRVPVGRIPAVSSSRSSTPSSSTVSSTTSRVVPAISVTIERSRPQRRFIRVDFPTFGLPAMATEIPRWSILPL